MTSAEEHPESVSFVSCVSIVSSHPVTLPLGSALAPSAQRNPKSPPCSSPMPGFFGESEGLRRRLGEGSRTTRAPARKSTGPRTAQGKQRSAFNSFQHGGFTRHEHLWRQALERSGDDPHALDRLRQPLLADWQPATAQQQLLIDDLAWLYWLRDRTRLAFLQLQARRLPQAQLDRDRRRFETRHRAPALSPSDCSPHGCVSLPPSLDKFRTLREFLHHLHDYASRAQWSDRDEGRA